MTSIDGPHEPAGVRDRARGASLSFRGAPFLDGRRGVHRYRPKALKDGDGDSSGHDLAGALDGRQVLGAPYVDLDDAEIERRRAIWVRPTRRYTSGDLAKYAKLVTSAARGAVTD